jgi:hypothetical protein
MSEDRALVDRLTQEAVHEFGTGYNHGDLTISESGYQRLFAWVLERLAADHGTIHFTPDEITSLRMALRWGVPDPEPELIVSARLKLETADVRWAKAK